jgi:putative CRISPR-associated protein (TIGR02619 family)
VGTSLLGKARNYYGKSDISARDAANFLRLVNNDTEASAETNSLQKILHRLQNEESKLVFLHSQTDEGQLCAEALRDYYSGLGFEVECREIQYLNYRESHFKFRGLRSLVNELVDLISSERKKGNTVCINATGGFKAEIAYATLVGILFDVRVYYIHEAFRDIIEMPPVPLDWDYSQLVEHEETLRWFSEDLRPKKEAESVIKVLPQEIRLLLLEEEGHVFLSPAGEAFFRAYLERLQQADTVPLLLSTSAWKAYQDFPIDVRQAFERHLRKLKMLEVRLKSSDLTRMPSGCRVFPRGHCDERIIFCEDQEGKIKVCALLRHSDQSYERYLKRKVACPDEQEFKVLW